MAKPISKDYLVKQLQNYDSQVIGKKYVLQEDGKGLFSGDYNDLKNTPSIPNTEDFITEEEMSNALSGYAKNEDIPDTSNFVEKETGKGLFSGSYNDLTDKPTIPNAYDDTALIEKVEGIEYSLDDKADKTELHTHANKDVLDGITSDKVTSWDSKATEAFVTNAIAQAQLNGSDVDLSGLATVEQLNEKADANHKHVISDITDYEAPDLSGYALKTEVPDVSNFVEKEEGKGLFSGSYNDLTNKPSIPSVDGLVSEDALNEVLLDYVKTDELPDSYDDTELSNRVKTIEDDYDEHVDNTTVHITSTERTNWNDANSKKHEHTNKSVLDGITSALITAWNNAVTHISDTVKHITSTERTNWTSAYTHSTSAHAPSNAEANQNAFSNVVVGSTTIAADSKTDSLTLVAGSNVTLTPDATNDKITIAATDTVYTHPNSGVTAGEYAQVTVDSQGHVTSGKTMLTQANIKSYVHSAVGASGTAGYVLIATIKIKANYAGMPLVIELANRGTISVTPKLYIRFKSADTSDPVIETFGYTDKNPGAYLHKSATSTWDLYVQKSEAWDSIDILRYHRSEYLEAKLDLTWKNVHATALPDGATAATHISPYASASHGTHVPATCTSITDWNSATATGWYMASNATNAPSENAWYFGYVIAHNANYVIQEVYQFTAASDASIIPKYIRVKQNGTWGAWKNVTVSKAVPSDAKFTDTTYGVATSSTLGLVKSGTDITVDSSGNVSVNDDSHNHIISNVDGLQTELDGKAASSHTHDDIYYTETEVDTKLQSINPAWLTDGYTKSPFYLNTHPENGPVLLPFMNNDLAYLIKRGGSVKFYVDGVEKTLTGFDTVFDGSPSYWVLNPTGMTTLVFELTLHKVFTWSSTFYIDSGSNQWRAQNLKIEVMNTNYTGDTWVQKGAVTNYGRGHWKVGLNHTPVGASNHGGGFNKIRLTISNFAKTTDFRIAAIGIYNYGSQGLRETFMPRDGGELLGNITPFKTNTYNLGSTDKVFSNVYATNFVGSASKVNGHTVGVDVPSNAKFTDTVYTHPTTSGNKHIPSGGSSGQILRWSADGTAVWGNDNNTTYTHPSYTAKSSGLYKVTVDGTGHVSATTAVAKSDITALGIPAQDTVYTLPTASSTLGGVKTTSTVTSTSGLTACPIISGVPYYKDTVYTHPTTAGNKHIPSGGSSGQVLTWSSSGTATWANPSASNSSNVQYLPSTDWVQLKNSSGSWVNWMKAGLVTNYLFNNGLGGSDIPLEDGGSDWNYSSSTSGVYNMNPDVTSSDTSIVLQTSGASQCTTFGTKNKINLTMYSTLHAEFTWNNTTTTLEVDLSAISGSAYVGVALVVGASDTYVRVFAASAKSYLKDTIISQNSVTAANSTARRTCTVTKLWLT